MRYLKNKLAKAGVLSLGIASMTGALVAQDVSPTIDSMGIDIAGLATNVITALGVIMLAGLGVGFSIWVVRRGIGLFKGFAR